MYTFLKSLFFFITISLIFSCSDDDAISTPDGSLKSLTGEELTVNTSLSDEQTLLQRDIVKEKFTKKSETGQLTLTDKLDAKSRNIHTATCNDVISGSTKYETNTVNKYSGADRVYQFDLDEETTVELALKDLNGDVDLFLAQRVTDGFGRSFIGDYLGSSIKSSSQDEYISMDLEEGEYYIIVDTWSGETDFTLVIDCQWATPPVPVFCEDHEQLTASYNYGISEQSALWNLWSSSANDGKVLYENYHGLNKVVKFDGGRFGYQDAVRDLIGLPLTTGWYTLNFDLFVAEGKNANFATEKTASYGQEQGFSTKIENGRLTIRHKGEYIEAQSQIAHNAWIPVHMNFDMAYNTVILVIENIVVLMDADANTRRASGMKSVQGVDFFNTNYKTKFHVDNMCVTEYESGYDNPISIQSISSDGASATYEVLDLRKN